MSSLVCPHCHTAVPQAASVCTGCGAEVVRGATRRERGCAGCLVASAFILIGLAISGLLLRESRSETGGPIVIATVIVALIAGYFIGGQMMRWLYRTKLRFFREYREK